MARAKLTDISGLGDRFAGRLRAAGFGSLAKLAAASPDDVGKVKGIARERAATFIAAARELGGAPAAATTDDLVQLETELREKIGKKGKKKQKKKQKKKRKKDRKKKRGKKDKKGKKGKKKK